MRNAETHSQTRRRPFAMNWAQPSRVFGEVTGHYDAKTQQWSERDMTMAQTYSRSVTTGIIFDDPDEDKDD